ncbi:MAG: tetratricopeptide repeat protein, partial [Gemmataceae bacterium]
MLVPVRLARRPAAEPAAALLLPSAGVAELLAVCAHLNADPLPKVFATADGFLVLLDAPTPLPVPGAIRLRRLADYLLVPADADLEPQLHADEATALTKARGLVVLAGGRVLEFAPDSPIPAEELIAVGPVRREGWEPFPKRRYIADQLRAITYERPMDTPEDVLSPGGEGIGEEEPRPPATGAIQTAAGHAQAGFGQFLAKLGAALGWKSLKERGEQLVRGAMESVPRLQEDILGRQEAALRDLLRRFREGKIEEALRRALPIGDGSHRGEAAADANLPTHDLRYSLGNMFGGSGPASFWFGGADVQRDLMREYRRAAELAMQHGDFRRAAFIYGKLLADWRAAAAALARGGLHHDAAVLFRDKLQNSLRAAQEFEAGGEFDEALAIYDRIPNHELAGDLLLRMGEEDAATERYLTVANDLMDSGRGPLAAGEFILRKANRADLAEPFFAAGWAQRHRLQNARDAVPCALHLAKMTADREDAGPFLELLEEAETYFATDGQPVAAGAFFNVVAQLADRPPLRPRREELRDRCLLGIAGKLREHAAVEQRAGNIVSAMLGESGAWGPPQVR